MLLLIASLIPAGMIITTSLLSYEILRVTWECLPRIALRPRLKVLVAVAAAFVAHIANIWIYAFAYFLTENLTPLGTLAGVHSGEGMTYENFLDALYFSAATYSSLGFGDIVPTGHLRMLAAAEVLNGLVLIGWTVSFSYLAMEAFWKLHRQK